MYRQYTHKQQNKNYIWEESVNYNGYTYEHVDSLNHWILKYQHRFTITTTTTTTIIIIIITIATTMKLMGKIKTDTEKPKDNANKMLVIK